MTTKDLAVKNLPVMITKQNKRFVAYTPALDISTSGESEKEVKARFAELASIFLQEILEAGTLPSVLSELGWKREQERWLPPKFVSAKTIDLEVPALA